MFNSQRSIPIRTAEAARVRAVLIEAGDLILHGANDAQSDIHFLMAAPYYLMFRAIALTLRAGLHSRPLIFG